MVHMATSVNIAANVKAVEGVSALEGEGGASGEGRRASSCFCMCKRSNHINNWMETLCFNIRMTH